MYRFEKDFQKFIILVTYDKVVNINIIKGEIELILNETVKRYMVINKT